MSRARLEKSIAALLKDQGAAFIPASGDDIFMTLEMSDNNAMSFMQVFAEKFSVDMSTFNRSLHIQDKPVEARAAYLPNGRLVPYLPITLDDLADAAANGRWGYNYPEYKVATVGWKDILQYILIAAVALWIIVSFFL